MRTYKDYLLEKSSKEDDEKIKDIKNDAYWQDDAASQIGMALGTVLTMGGFMNDNSIEGKLKAILNSNGNKERFESMLDLVKDLIKKPSSEWEMDGKKFKPLSIVYKLKDALEDIKNAIITAKGASDLTQEQVRKLKDVRDPRIRAYQDYMNNTKSKVNGFISLLNGRRGIKSTKSRAESLYPQYATLNARIDHLLTVINPILDPSNKGLSPEQIEELEKTISELNDIKDENKGYVERLKNGSDVRPKDFQENIIDQNKRFNEAKNVFFDNFEEYMVVDSRHKKVDAFMLSVQEHLSSVEEIIESSKDAKSMFKGVDRKSDIYKHLKHLDDAAEDSGSASDDALLVRKGLKPKSSEDKGEDKKETSFNTRTVEVDKQIREIFDKGIDMGKVEADAKRLSKLLGISK